MALKRIKPIILAQHTDTSALGAIALVNFMNMRQHSGHVYTT